ncbi:hypothetical protein SSCG_03662 [Streptomyces clavuligerus]|nr:hypothetical protein SSCG_03662 [Streptomyces clavuligerus]
MMTAAEDESLPVPRRVWQPLGPDHLATLGWVADPLCPDPC